MPEKTPLPKVPLITKPELIWPGKYDEHGLVPERPRVSLPFQVIETVNESRAAREARKAGVQSTLFGMLDANQGETFEAGWRNKLIWGENQLVMGSLLENFAGKVNLIYIDPPFATGADFSLTAEIGESGEEVEKERSLIEEKAYRDTWGSGLASYLNMIRERLVLMRDLLAPNGSIYVHLDQTVGHYVKAILDEVFGDDNFVNEIAWCYEDVGGRATPFFKRKHDTIFFYQKGGAERKFNVQRKGLSESTIKRYKPYFDAKGQITYRRLKETNPGVFAKLKGVRDLDEIWLDEKNGAPLNDWWTDISPLKVGFSEHVGYPTQKPEGLLDRIISASTEPGDLVVDFFCGGGTALASAEKLGRRWIGCDLGRWAVHVTRKRLLAIEKCKPFEVLNLGKYERQYWQGMTFGTKTAEAQGQMVHEYLGFILRLYGAQPITGFVNLHGKKGRALVHIGAIDAPVTIAEIDAAVEECVKARQPEVHVLGWEWEMGLYDLIMEAATRRGIKLVLLQIPREVMEKEAADKADVRFFELAYLEATVEQPKKASARVELKDFVIPNGDLVPAEVRAKVTKWSDFVDYWAIDWDFQNDTFMQGWVAFRTRKDRTLPLVSDSHTYPKAGKYRILVKVIDIFGNDTSQAFDIEVK